MISSIIDAILLSALTATSICVLLMYRRLQRFDALQSEAAKAFVRSSQALDNARAALDALHEHSGEMAVSLAARLNEARLVINEIDNGTAGKRPGRPDQRGQSGTKPVSPQPAWQAPEESVPDIDFAREWDPRFSNLQTAARAKNERSATAAFRSDYAPGHASPQHGMAPTLHTPIADGQSLTVTWAALSDAARRNG